MRIQFTRRLYVLFTFVALFAGVLGTRLYFVQIVEGREYTERAEHQYVLPSQSLYDRGSIFFSDKDGGLVSAATLQSGFTVAINPTLIENPELVYERVGEIMPLDRDTFLARASKAGDPYEEIGKRVGSSTAHSIAALELPGVNIYKERWRYYPGDELAAHTIGFVAYQGDEQAGRYGLERHYEDVLSRTKDGVYVNFFAEIFSDLGAAFFSDKEREGSIVTTIEPSVQLELERRLHELQEEWQSKQVGGIVMDPKTGAIYALASVPSFNLNQFSEERNVHIFGNPLVESVFEMGSIVKPLTVAAGLDAGVVTAETKYDDRGSLVFNGSRIANFDGEGRGRVPVQEILNQSLNTGAAFVEQQLGNERFREYMLAYGLGEKTGIDLPGEVAGLVGNLESPRDIEYVTASFGQGIAMTPIETARALATLGNGGTLVTPHVVQEIRYESGLRKATAPEASARRVLKEETSTEITRMLVEVFDDALVDGAVRQERYSIASKTGTAQIANKETGGYYDDRYLHSFFGYFPAYQPRFLVFLYHLEPVGARYASQTLTEPFMDMFHFLTNYYHVTPDR